MRRSALGVDATLVKLAAMTLSAAITAAGGCFYAQYFLFIDSGIAYGPWISVEALLAPIIGGIGTVFGPLLGALVVKTLGELTKLVTGDAPGLDLVIYGSVLILVVAFAPRGIAGLVAICAAASAATASERAMAEPLLRVENVSKRFGGLLAVDRASFAAEAGRITALIGPNGAGKTTLFSIITGFLPPSEGRIFYDGTDITGEPPHRLARRGIARTFQIVQPFAGLTVRENIAVGAHLSRAARAPTRWPRPSEVARSGRLGRLLDRPAASLTVAGRKRLELARALAIEPRLLLLDEVLAGLNPSEIRDMVPVIRAIRDRGVTIVMIEHVMQAVMSLAEHVFVLSEGRIIAEGRRRRSPAIRAWSRPISATAPQAGCCGSAPMAEPMLAVSGLHAGYGATEILRGIDLAVGAGEIVAVLGSNGAGKSTLNRAISGVTRPGAAPSGSRTPRSSARGPRPSSRAG